MSCTELPEIYCTMRLKNQPETKPLYAQAHCLLAILLVRLVELLEGRELGVQQ